eukprot:1450920-Pyramimonas_sp.AAC.1
MVSSGTALKAKSGKRFAKMRRRTARLLQLRRGGKGMAKGMGLVYMRGRCCMGASAWACQIASFS